MADKKLFELNENATPADSKRLAIGDASSGAENITLANFYTRLMSKLGFLKVANYFSEYLGNPAAQGTAQTNLDVYSRGQIDIAIGNKANKSNVIEKDSTTAFTPTLATHPANKKYVDDRFRFGTFTFGDVPDPAVSKIVTFSPPFADNNYIVLIEMNSLYGEVSTVCVFSNQKTLDTFKVAFVEDPVGGGQNVVFSYVCIHL